MRNERRETLLELRNCTKGHAAALARELRVPHSTALKRIKTLEEKGIVTDYIPVVNQDIFGSSFLVKFKVSYDQYRFEQDLRDTIAEIIDHLTKGIGHAPYAIFDHQNVEDRMWSVSCLTLTSDIVSMIDYIRRRHNVLPENISYRPLGNVTGVPMYSRHSLNIGSEDG